MRPDIDAGPIERKWRRSNGPPGGVLSGVSAGFSADGFAMADFAGGGVGLVGVWALAPAAWTMRVANSVTEAASRTRASIT